MVTGGFVKNDAADLVFENFGESKTVKKYVPLPDEPARVNPVPPKTAGHKAAFPDTDSD